MLKLVTPIGNWILYNSSYYTGFMFVNKTQYNIQFKMELIKTVAQPRKGYEDAPFIDRVKSFFFFFFYYFPSLCISYHCKVIFPETLLEANQVFVIILYPLKVHVHQRHFCQFYLDDIFFFFFLPISNIYCETQITVNGTFSFFYV